MTDSVCPPLGTGSVDFNAVNAAAAKGKDLVAAIADATTGGPPREKTREERDAELRAAIDASEPAGLSGKNKDQLLEIAANEGVAITDEMNTNPKIVAAIEAKREADNTPPALGPVAPVDSGSTGGNA